MSSHDCPGLSLCVRHPKWHVARLDDVWCVFPPLRGMAWGARDSHANAMAWADHLSRPKEQR